MNRITERSQPENHPVTPTSPYESPKIIELGKSKTLIRGAATDGYADNSHDFYTTGE